MADDPNKTSDIPGRTEPAANITKEDAETTAARRELKQTTLSEKRGREEADIDGSSDRNDDDAQGSQDGTSPPDNDGHRGKMRRFTPPTGLSVGKGNVASPKEQISSPNKKRARDELDGRKDVVEATPGEDDADTSSSPERTLHNRRDRSEPEQKRRRDRQASASAVLGAKEEVEPLSARASPRSSVDRTHQDSKVTTTDENDDPKNKKTSSASFAKSGFAKLAGSSTSPFGSHGGSSKPSLFGASSKSSSFGPALGESGPSLSASASTKPKFNFGGATTSSPFATHNKQGSGLSSLLNPSPFTSVSGGTRISGWLSNSSKAGESFKSGKSAVPFGAPATGDGNTSGEKSGERNQGGNTEDSSEDKSSVGSDENQDSKGTPEKKQLLQKVAVDNGEGEEVTLFSRPADMYVSENGKLRQRGSGTLKLNVLKSTVKLDDNGVPIPTSFNESTSKPTKPESKAESDDDDDSESEADQDDGSADESTSVDTPALGEGDGGKPQGEDKARKLPQARFIMRQNHTLNLILNSTLQKSTSIVFNPEYDNRATFSATVDGKLTMVVVRMSPADVSTFMELATTLRARISSV